MSVRGGGRPNGYYLADGTRIPSVTTILSRFKDSGGLVYVAKKNWHEAGRRGLPFERDAYWGKLDDPTWGVVDATHVGSIVHNWIEDHLHGAAPRLVLNADEATLYKAEVGFGAFLEWAQLVNVKVSETETPLVSERFRYGGTLDCCGQAIIGSRTVLLDWKTSKNVYDDYKLQLAAYRQLLRERDGGDAPKIAYLLQVSKQTGDFSFHRWGEKTLDWAWRQFALYLEAYENEKAAA